MRSLAVIEKRDERDTHSVSLSRQSIALEGDADGNDKREERGNVREKRRQRSGLG